MPSLKSLNSIAMLTTKSVATSHLTVFFFFFEKAHATSTFWHVVKQAARTFFTINLFTPCSSIPLQCAFSCCTFSQNAPPRTYGPDFALHCWFFWSLQRSLFLSSPNKLGTETRLKLNDWLAALGEILLGAAFSWVACVAVHVKSPLKLNLLEATWK